MIDQVAAAKRILDEWTKTKQPLKERAAILPFGQYEDGSVGLAWPGLLAAPAEGMVNFGRYGYDSPEAIADNARSAFDVAGGAMTGGLGVGLAGGMADNAVGSAGKEAARLARAKALGFDTDNVWYHGSPHTFDEFEIGPKRVGTGGGDPYQPMSELGAFFTQDPEIAALYGPNVRQFYVRGEYPELYNPVANKPEAVDTIDQTVADMRQLLSRGYEGAKLTGPGTEPELAVFNPRNIRSVDAAFDPAMSDSANLLAANAKSGAAVPLLQNALERAGTDLPATAAFKFGDDVFTGQYHGNAIRDAVDKYGKDAIIAYRDANGLDDLQGFQTLGGDFISRQQAAENIRRSGRAPGENVPDELHSDYLNELRAKGLWANAPTGSSVPLAMNALERAGADLPMDLASRIARAKEMGFDTENVLLHTSRANEPFDAFDAGRIGSGSGNDGFYGRGFYATPDIEYAEDMLPYGGGGHIREMFARTEKPFVIDYSNFEDAAKRAAEIYPDAPLGEGGFMDPKNIDGWTEALKRNGYDSVVVKSLEGDMDSHGSEFLALYPNRFRDINAAFDPAMSDSANLLAANAKSGAAVPLLQNALERSNVRSPSGPWPETAGFDERLGAVRQTFENPNELYRLPLPWSKATPEDRLPYRHDDLIDGKEATTKEVQIRDLLSWQDNAVRDDVRALTNPETRAGAGEPTVVRYRGNDQIVDGHHRLLADLLNGADAATVRYIDSLLANSPTGSSVPLLQNALERAQPQGIRAYHGSPHDFDRFSLDKIGTGEGAQAYGHGLYFAEEEDVARRYREVLSQKSFPYVNYKGQQVDFIDLEDLIPEDIAMRSDLALNQAVSALADYGSFDAARKGVANGWKGLGGQRLTRSLDVLEQLGFQGAEPNIGRMYEVNIKANPEDFLDWDKPLSQQSEKVRGVVSSLKDFQDHSSQAARLNDLEAQNAQLGGALTSQLQAMRAQMQAQEQDLLRLAVTRPESTQALREAGIPGIRYLDGMSRGAGQGSSNYVVFDDALVEILRKYANAPTGAAVPLAGETQDTDPALLEYLRMIGL